jgi:hypothetical protein
MTSSPASADAEGSTDDVASDLDILSQNQNQNQKKRSQTMASHMLSDRDNL